MKFHLAAAAFAASSLLLTACGSDSDPKAGDPADSAPALSDAKAVVVDYFTKAFVGDAAACTHETKAYDAIQNEENGAASCADRVGSFKELMVDGKPVLDVAKTVVNVTEGEKGTALAEVTHELEGSGGTYRLIVQDGVWKIDGDVTETGDSGSDGSGDDTSSADAIPSRPEPRTVTEKEAIAIERAFCQVKPGVTRTQVESWLGKPDEELVDDDGQPELSWYLNQDSYTVWLNESGAVDSSSSSTPREAVVC